MGFLDKLSFRKKNDDYSSGDYDKGNYGADDYLTTANSGQDSFLDQESDFSLPPQEEFSSNQQSYNDRTESKDQLPEDPYMNYSNQNSSQNSSQEFQQESSPQFRSIQDDTGESESQYGKRLARKYIAEQEHVRSQPSSDTISSPQSIEFLNLKIDAMKSDLALANQRLQKIEHLLEAQAKRRY
jgi:hypothetical protein